jgi:carbon storage regulator CsrA
MLVLSRKLNQEIVIGDNVKVTVLKIKGNTVRLGIEAPRNIRVIRGELPVHEEAPAEMAEVTIVFNNDTEQPLDDSCLDVVPFDPNAKRQSESSRSSSTPKATTHRESLPKSLSSNRLSEILAELSGQ